MRQFLRCVTTYVVIENYGKLSLYYSSLPFLNEVLILFSSHLQLEQEIEGLSLTEQSNSSSESVSPTAHSAPVTPSCNPTGSVDIDYSNGQQGGFFEGLLGCLRPVWTIIGKAAAAELKQQGEIQ